LTLGVILSFKNFQKLFQNGSIKEGVNVKNKSSLFAKGLHLSIIFQNKVQRQKVVKLFIESFVTLSRT